MTRTFDSIPQFELFIYSLPKKYPTIISSTLVFKRLGRSIGEVAGTIQFPHHITLKVHERVDFLDDTIESYSYEVYQKNEILYWYDPQPHPNDPSLAASFPHHKHVHPNIKHNRIPAPGIGFKISNLLFLVEEIQELLVPPKK